jgi:hypothetical protein
MRWIDEIIQKIHEHPNISEIHKLVLIVRVEAWPTEEELEMARLMLKAQKEQK